MKTYTYIDLCCGLGAFHQAFDIISTNTIKYECVFACDINKDIRLIYEENYDIIPFGNIFDINISKLPSFDILCAGFPCQPFSIAGNRKGFDDKHNGNIFNKLLDIIDAKQPEIIILENVKNLHTIHEGETFNYIKVQLENKGYIVSYKVIDSKFHKCPQSRKRIYIICSKQKKYEFKDIQHPVIPVSSIIDYTIDEYVQYNDKYLLEHCTGKNLVYKLINKETGKGGRQGERVYSIHSYGPTICASSGGIGGKTGLYEIYPLKIRTLHVNEVLCMFGFKSSFKYTSLKHPKKLIGYLGNSIVVNVLVDILNDLQLLLD